MSPVIVLIVLSLVLFLGLSVTSLGLSITAFLKQSVHTNGSQLVHLNASSFETGILDANSLVSSTFLSNTPASNIQQLGFHEVSLGEEGAAWDGVWDVANAQSARVILEENVAMPVPLSMVSGFQYTLTLIIPVHGPTLTFVGAAFRGESSVTFSSILRFVKSGDFINVTIHPFGSIISTLNPSHWYTMRLPNAYTAPDNKISSWVDFGYGSSNLVMEDVASRPSLVGNGNGLNGVAGILFNGSTSLRASSTLQSFLNPQVDPLIGGQSTVFMAIKYSSGTSLWTVESDEGINPKAIFPTSTQIRYTSFGGAVGTASVSDLQNTVKIITVHDISNSVSAPILYVNGVIVGSGNGGSADPPNISAQLGLGTGFEGIISELIFFPSFLTTDELQLVWSEMSPAYGV